MKKLSEDELRLISKFMSDNLSHEETLAFNQKLGDPDFNHELEFQRGIARSINDVQRNLLRDEFRKQLRTKEEKKLNPAIYWAAAAIVLLAVAGIYFFTRISTNEQLFTTYFKPYPAPVVTRGEGLEQPKEIEQALSQYRVGEYAASAKSLETLLGSDAVANADELKLLLGNCYLQLNEPSKAQHQFSSIAASNHGVLNEHAEWYGALTLVKLNRPEEALPILNTISQSNSIYRQQASDLAKNLNANN